MKKESRTRILVEAALMVAISSVLCVYPKFKFLTNGGSVTLCSMLPIILLSYRRGLKWGFAGAFVFSLVQILTGFSASGLTPLAVAIEFLFDYLIAFTVLGIGGIFRDRLGSVKKELVCGSLLALGLRFLSHFISGYIVWGEYAEWFFESLGDAGQKVLSAVTGKPLMLLYSAVYNGSYMIPEMILTCIVAVIIAPMALYGMTEDTQQ